MAAHVLIEEYGIWREIHGREAGGSVGHWDVDAVSG